MRIVNLTEETRKNILKDLLYQTVVERVPRG